jgi:hypothetical protein
MRTGQPRAPGRDDSQIAEIVIRRVSFPAVAGATEGPVWASGARASSTLLRKVVVG